MDTSNFLDFQNPGGKIIIGIIGFLGGLVPFAFKWAQERVRHKDAENKHFNDLSVALAAQLQKEEAEMRDALRQDIISLRGEVKSLKEENAKLEKENRELKARVNTLEINMASLNKKELSRLRKESLVKKKGKKRA